METVDTIYADLILHVIDIDDLDLDWKIEVVMEVLEKIGCANKKIIFVFNKIDLNQFDALITRLKKEHKKFNPVFISALEKINLDELKSKIAENL